MKSVRGTAAYIKWHLKRNEDILDNLKIIPMTDYIQSYLGKLKEHVNYMNTQGIAKQIFLPQRRGQRSVGCPVNRWEENMRL
jgi:hypothetical protein